jgi:dihydroorotate dehydrogenase (NAD+) catalytic subunit
MLAGATAVQVGSAALRDPFCYIKIINGIRSYMEEFHIKAVSDLIGAIVT